VAGMNFGVSISAGTVCDLPARVVAEVALPADETTLVKAEPMRGVRYLVASDLRIFGQDRGRLFLGPGLRQHAPLHDAFHPTDSSSTGSIAGAWGRRAGKVSVKGPTVISAVLTACESRT
jgi:hypothetical protein